MLGDEIVFKKTTIRKTDVFHFVFVFYGKGLRSGDDKSRGGWTFPLSEARFPSFPSEKAGPREVQGGALAFFAHANNPGNLPFQLGGHVAKSTSRQCVRFEYLNSCP